MTASCKDNAPFEGNCLHFGFLGAEHGQTGRGLEEKETG